MDIIDREPIGSTGKFAIKDGLDRVGGQQATEWLKTCADRGVIMDRVAVY
ncbi:hypothetical protein PC129_g20705 [Phytophthora cactorum]|uniref:Uncharacterized protein n=1 Tax=Phytophthora cactorum TaxID=29920 RepID=A0A329RLA2_9STRA|nr:hypothetical protein Pcac1_g8350 [Phytophthora cactorum]KAG2798597.1 hypothetical protein PC111_g20784 [Phytophthora cactorum]KAG2798606.1 hypothetical protein PC112_g21273 [Phytophthora cactorum]KAG2829801.1 hypothetical protein PC113_g21223 [Phytophthora cactorum]KAG2877664.1 hypothetical protein PC114_g23518 [Phytophthora cactorum]